MLIPASMMPRVWIKEILSHAFALLDSLVCCVKTLMCVLLSLALTMARAYLSRGVHSHVNVLLGLRVPIARMSCRSAAALLVITVGYVWIVSTVSSAYAEMVSQGCSAR